MKLSEYINNQIRKNETSRLIVKKLHEYSDNEEFIAGVLLDLKNDDDKITFLDYLNKGIDVNYEQIILNALYLSQQRNQ